MEVKETREIREAKEMKAAGELAEAAPPGKVQLGTVLRCFRSNDPGSGTMAGVALIMLAATMLSVLAAAGSLFIAQTRARSAADLAALSSATSLWNGEGDPCTEAKSIALAHKGRLESCRVDGEIVSVKVSVRTRVPLISRVSRSARAGPIDCS
ncbi:MAG: flp pilus-assembly TadE/G-like family protein [Bifidobacterium sp.]|jgi:secretion/DNA translocation related TadE-like protein|nr:flp pilus-assembly TadE/G-like family protein [Bifidobacterium sp.]